MPTRLVLAVRRQVVPRALGAKEHQADQVLLALQQLLLQEHAGSARGEAEARRARLRRARLAHALPDIEAEDEALLLRRGHSAAGGEAGGRGLGGAGSRGSRADAAEDDHGDTRPL